MKALLIHGKKQTAVTVEEIDGGLIVRMADNVLFTLQPVLTELTGRNITVQDLDNSPASKRYELLIERFSNSREDMSDLVMDLMDDYKRLTGRRYEAVAQLDNQLEQDVRAIKPHAAMLFANGDLARGWQSRIAEILDLPGTGGSHRRRIISIGHALREIYFSTAEKVSTDEVENGKRRFVGR